MRIAFMGTPEFSVPTLKRLVDSGHHVVAVYTRAPKPAGRRGLKILKTPVHQAADTMGIEVHTPSTFRNSDTQDQFQALSADLVFVVAYGLILPKLVLDAPRYGCLNLHASLLPRWRGAAPIQRAIMAGDIETGVDLMRMEEGLDTGPVGLRRVVAIRPQDTAGDLTARLAEISADIAADGLAALQEGTLALQDQAATGACYAHKINTIETEIDWLRSAIDMRNHIHGLSPTPGAFSTLTIGARTERIKIYRAEYVSRCGSPGEVISADMTVACGVDAIRILECQRAGRMPVSGRDLLNGRIGSGAAFSRS